MMCTIILNVLYAVPPLPNQQHALRPIKIIMNRIMLKVINVLAVALDVCMEHTFFI